MSNLKISKLHKHFGTVDVLKDINLDIRSGEFVVFVGPSGCGKSTLLRCISGLEAASSGSIEIDGQVIDDVEPAQRGIAMVFQNYALYPHMDVFGNMAFSLKMQGLAKDEIRRKVEAAAEKLQLTQYLDRLPAQEPREQELVDVQAGEPARAAAHAFEAVRVGAPRGVLVERDRPGHERHPAPGQEGLQHGLRAVRAAVVVEEEVVHADQAVEGDPLGQEGRLVAEDRAHDQGVVSAGHRHTRK